MADYKDQAKRKNPRTQETWARIEKAREHYRTRASRRPKGQSQSDLSLYDEGGSRRSHPSADEASHDSVLGSRPTHSTGGHHGQRPDLSS